MDDLTIIIAIWGALVSTIALTWNILNSIRDKGKIKISIRHSFIRRDKLINENPRLEETLSAQYGPDTLLIPIEHLLMYIMWVENLLRLKILV